MKLTRKSILLLVMLASCMLLSACDLTEVSFEAQSKNELAPSTAEQTTATAETMLQTETETKNIYEDTQASEAQTQQPDEFDASGLSKYLILEITDFLDNYLTQYSMSDTSFAIKLYDIKHNGFQPLYVKFNEESYYYACAYFNPMHEYEEESYPYCCTQEYTWVKYEKPEQITDTFDGMKLICAFQINKSEFCHDIGPAGGLSENIEHYSPYEPEFAQGINVAPRIEFDECFIYLNRTPLETVYCTMERPYHEWVAMPCMEFDGKYFVPYYLYIQNADGAISGELDLQRHFGEYYDHIMSVMIKDRYHVLDQFDRTTYYGLIAVDEITKMISE